MVSSGAEKEGEGWSVQDASGRGIQTPVLSILKDSLQAPLETLEGAPG